jgi:A/G-specific adenine glycosylase
LNVLSNTLISAHNVRDFRRALLRWYGKNGRDFPWRQTQDPYAILVSEFMLQQTQVATVLPYYNEWLELFPNLAVLARATENDVLHAWQGLGYYTRARNLHGAAKLIVARHDGILPREVPLIRELPGVGRYTANAVATFAFDQPVPVVEANIARLLSRVFDVTIPIDSTAGRTILWNFAAQLVPARGARVFNSALMDLGALVCSPRAPRCHICPVKNFCRAPNPEILPIKRARLKLKRITEMHTWTVRGNKVLLEQSVSRWRGMWILPALRPLSERMRTLHTSVFPFTNHRITLKIFAGRPKPRSPRQRWFAAPALALIPIPSPHRRAITALLSPPNSSKS